MKRFLALLPLLALAGCEQTRPLTPEGLKLIIARTAQGTKNTKLETKTQPAPPRAGQVSIWDFKVFDMQDQPNKTRKEWKFFNDLPQSSTENSTTGVLMNAWLISKDRGVFLPQKPNYKQYGSFVTDWTIPNGGPYTLWVEYQPVVAKDELSFEDLKKAPALPVEHAHWDVSVEGTAKASLLHPSQKGGAFQIYSADSSDYAHSSDFNAQFSPTNVSVAQKTTFVPTINSKSQISDQSLTALSPDGNTLLHAVGDKPQLTFGQKGTWRAWFTFSVDGNPYVCPVDLNVA